ncbi:MAG: hypothetical protein OEY00_04545 [Gammaproteobacteria bacterium]|nr:hypothetical protein [Gammaproteobacteria bacterium]
MSLYNDFVANLKKVNLFYEKDEEMVSLCNIIQKEQNRPNKAKTIVAAAAKIGNENVRIYHHALSQLYRALNIIFGMPKNFKVLSKTSLAGMSRFVDNDQAPQLWAYAYWLYKQGYRTVISIEASGSGVTKRVVEGFPGMKWHSCFLADWHAPSVEHLDAYYRKVRDRLPAGKVITHCDGGTGRTGCFLAAYLLGSRQAKDAGEALKLVRENYSEHAVEMKIQYNALARYSDSLGNPASPAWHEVGGVKGNWHATSGDSGLEHDPGHRGDHNGPLPGDINRYMIASRGYAITSPGYVGEDVLSSVKKVDGNGMGANILMPPPAIPRMPSGMSLSSGARSTRSFATNDIF